MVYPKFEAAAGRSALFELKVRLLADKTKEIADLSDAHDFDRVCKGVLRVFRDRITEKESTKLQLAKKLRDFVVHGDFQKAFWKLGSEPSGVRALKFDDAQNGGGILAAIMGTQTGETKTTLVPFTKDVGKFGWLLEAATGGLLDHARAVSNDAIGIIDRISLDTARGL